MATKRGNNEGSISKRADGRWTGRVTLRDGKRKDFYGRTRAEVAGKVTGALRDLEQGKPVVSGRESVEKYLNRWLATTVLKSVRPSTYSSYAQHVRDHLIPHIGHLKLAALTPEHVQKLLNTLQKAGLSPMTVLHVRATLRRALGQALKWELVTRNVAALVDPPKTRRHKVEAIAPDRAREILEAVRGHRLEALVTVAIAVGLRQGEALGLRWRDVSLDAEHPTLAVRHALQRINGKLELVEPKSDTSRRTVPLPEKAVVALRRHRAMQSRDRLSAGDLWEDNDYVFASPVGKAIDGPNVTRTFQQLLKAAGLPRHRFHDLRHDCATLLLAQGVPMRVVMETLGHSQISLTMDTYSHVLPDLQREAAAKMDKALGA